MQYNNKGGYMSKITIEVKNIKKMRYGRFQYLVGKFKDNKLVGQALCRNKWEVERVTNRFKGVK